VDYTPWLTSPPAPPPAPVASGLVESSPPGALAEREPRADRLHAGDFAPARGERTIRFDLAAPSRPVRIGIYDVAGRLVRTLLDEVVPPGAHSIRWDGLGASGDELVSGVYFLRMRAGSFESARRLVLVR
jgi:hypothetical protein